MTDTSDKFSCGSRSLAADWPWQMARASLVTIAGIAWMGTAMAQALCQPGTTTQDYAYTGAQQSYVVPAGVDQIAVQVFGAQGNGGAFVAGSGSTGGLGGSAKGTLATAAGQSLFVFVGGQGNGGLGGVADTQSRAGGNGGEASDLRLGSNAIGSRVIVAGGGGGGGGQSTNGGVQGSGGNGGAGGGDAGGNGANAIDAPTLTGGGGQGGQSGVGGAPGQGCSFASGTAGNGTTGQGGSGVSIAFTSNFGGAGGGGGGGHVVGGGGGGGTAGTAMCTLNLTGAGGGGAGGTSAAFAGISGFASSNGVRFGHGFVRLCIPATAQALRFSAVPSQTYSAGGTFSINAAASNIGPNSGNPITYASLTPGICTVSGTTVSMVSLGTCTLEARQAGSTIYTSASPVSQNVLIGAAVAVPASIPTLSEWSVLAAGLLIAGAAAAVLRRRI